MAVDQARVYAPGVVGPSFTFDGGEALRPRIGRTGESITAFGHSPHYEQASRGKVYNACNQSVITFGTALTATGVTFHLCNPISSQVNLEILQTRITVLTGGTGGHIVYAYNPPSGTAVTAGTALTVMNAFGSSGVGQAKSATTLPAAPTAIGALVSVVTAAGIFAVVDYVDGSIIVPPGAQLSVQGITVVGTGLVSMMWSEVPLQG